MTAPRVSVIIPTYNRKDYVQEAIDSVLAQTYVDYEVVVVDDGSTDGTAEELQARYGNRIRYVWQENQGESSARNLAIEMAQGEFIAFLDSDDLWLPEKLERQVDFFQTVPDCQMVCGQAWLIDEYGQRHQKRKLGLQQHQPPGAPLTFAHLLMRNTVAGPSTTMIRAWICQQTGGFDPQIRYGEDWDFWLRIARVSPIHAIESPIACIRRHRGGQCYFAESSSKIARVLSDHLYLLQKALDSSATETPVDLQNRAIANRYLTAFLDEVYVGTAQNAHRYLQSAQGHAPELLTDMDWFGRPILYQMINVLEAEPDSDPEAGLSYVHKILGLLKDVGAHEPRFARTLLAASNATLGFWIMESRGNRAARPFLVDAVRMDGRWLRNRGLVATVARSFLPGGPEGARRS